MVSSVARYGFGPHHSPLRPSILGSAVGGRTRHARLRIGDSVDTDEAPRSAETEAKMREAIASLGSGEIGAHAAAAVDDVIRSFRKDNAAGGLGVFEHLPLPNELARSIAQYFHSAEPSELQGVDYFIGRLKPSVRRSVTQQVEGLMLEQGTEFRPGYLLRMPEDELEGYAPAHSLASVGQRLPPKRKETRRPADFLNHWAEVTDGPILDVHRDDDDGGAYASDPHSEPHTERSNKATTMTGVTHGRSILS